MPAGAIVVDVEKPGRIIVRNNMIISLSLSVSMKCRAAEKKKKRDGADQNKKKKKKSALDQNSGR